MKQCSYHTGDSDSVQPGRVADNEWWAYDKSVASDGDDSEKCDHSHSVEISVDTPTHVALSPLSVHMTRHSYE